MLTIREITDLLQDRNLVLVARRTGLSYTTIKRWRDKPPADPSYTTVRRLSQYFEHEAPRAGRVRPRAEEA